MLVSKDLLIRLVIIGNSSSRHTFRSQVGSGSRSHDLFGLFLMLLATCSAVVGVKRTRLVSDSVLVSSDRGSVRVVLLDVRLFQIVWIFSTQ